MEKEKTSTPNQGTGTINSSRDDIIYTLRNVGNGATRNVFSYADSLT